jgi:K319L-like, PKD domain/GDSL-like Lipase/Acylhydrolase family
MNMKSRLPSIQLFVFFLAIIITSPVYAATIQIMPLGDSITAGSSSGVNPDLPENDISYRETLHDLLVAAGYDVAFVGSQTYGSAVFADYRNEGHPGYTAAQLIDDGSGGGIYTWLTDNPANVVLLHIGTNDLNVLPPADVVTDVSSLLDTIDQWATDHSVKITVILARIINRQDYLCPNSSTTTTYNDDLNAMAQTRIDSGDRIKVVDMECGAGIDYRLIPDGDMDNLEHPYSTGYDKMAQVWFAGYQAIQPVANAGADQDVQSADVVTLDGSNSSDHFGDALSYQWTQTQGTTVTLSNSQSAKPTFTAPYVGSGGETLTFQLTVTDPTGLVATATTSVSVVYPGQPVADAGPDQTVNENQLVTLDGSGSHDPDNDPLTYSWEQKASDPIQVTLSNPTAVHPSFTAPSGLSQNTALTFNLVVNDGHVDSPVDSVVITVTARIPVADAGPDQTVNENQLVTLDGSGSHDPDNDPLTYSWEQKASDPTQVTLSNPTAVHPSFTAPSGLSQNTALTFDLVVNNGRVDSAADSVVITVTVPSSGGGGGGGGCFISTAAHGSLLEPHLNILREFRDRFLLDNRIGNDFVNFYYKYSPPIAHVIARHGIPRAAVRLSLFPLVGISWLALHVGPVPALTLMGIMCFLAILMLRTLPWRMRRRQ